MNAEIIAVGSEMLTPHRQDTNSLYLTAGLNDLGVSVAFKTIVGDNRKHLTSAIRIALRRADILVLSGGLGPTQDDLTRECTAEALGLALTPDPDILEAIHQRFVLRNMAMPLNNARQADTLDTAELLPNKNGTAPGQYLDTTFEGYRKLVLLLPGPPKELKPLFDEECKPRLAAALPEFHLARRVLRMALIPESQVDARTSPIYSQFTDVETTILAGHGEIQLHFLCAKPTLAAAQERVDQLAEYVEHEMGDDIFSLTNEDLEVVVLHLLEVRGHTLSVAESCTGGWLGERLTGVPNSSRVFLGGAIAYSNQAKTALADVPAYLLEEHGAVSEPAARALAEGIRRRTGSSLAISITGIAGPAVIAGPNAGPDVDKPIGLVYIALTTPENTQVTKLQVPGDRDRVRLWSVMHALEILRHYLQ